MVRSSGEPASESNSGPHLPAHEVVARPQQRAPALPHLQSASTCCYALLAMQRVGAVERTSAVWYARTHVFGTSGTRWWKGAEEGARDRSRVHAWIVPDARGETAWHHACRSDRTSSFSCRRRARNENENRSLVLRRPGLDSRLARWPEDLTCTYAYHRSIDRAVANAVPVFSFIQFPLASSHFPKNIL